MLQPTLLRTVAEKQDFAGIEKHFVDALRVYEVQAIVLDLEYLGKRATSPCPPRRGGT